VVTGGHGGRSQLDDRAPRRGSRFFSILVFFPPLYVFTCISRVCSLIRAGLRRVSTRGRIEKGQERFEEEQRRFRAAEEVFLRTDDEHIVCCYIMVD
jgi:hypothetical protein